ncbi:MAG: branched-chain amino acid transport system II carrier protein [Endozoicomonadaceae bacterium]|nr:branched-chain amino acid transport system II carrier protein [Endozoicomonadaceae bacterium]
MLTSNQQSFIKITFMIFAFFFGAGNIIFPPLAGYVAGDVFLSSYTGYILIDVGFSLLAIITIAYLGRAQQLTTDFPKHISIIFWLILYLIIGPIFAIPRVTLVAYNMSIAQFVEADSLLNLFIFTTFFFSLALFSMFRPARLVNIIGGWLTPILLIFLLVLYSILILSDAPLIMHHTIESSKAFSYGLIQGYLTMDAIAALAFGILIHHAVKNHYSHNPTQIRKTMIQTSILAGILLAAVYLGLFYLGATFGDATHHTYENGVAILTQFVKLNLGFYGQIILAIIIFLACLTTAIGLLSACSEYFNFLNKRISYEKWAIILSVISLALTNLGLNRIVALSLPCVITLYPIVIVLIVINALRIKIKIPKIIAIQTISITFFMSLLDSAVFIYPAIETHPLIQNIPLIEDKLSWLIPATLFFIVRMKIYYFKNMITGRFQHK